jgi:NAD(P)-dependent dehydrogenase (short-subunit alcohol dehydrogenase family)
MDIQQYFQGKGCVVTGAASGIGYAVTEALLAAGASVLLADRDQSTLEAAVVQLGAHAGRVHSLVVDVANEEQVRHMTEEAVSRLGRLDVLFNNAGIAGSGPIEKATIEFWRRIIDINLWGVIYGIHYALPIMRRQGGGHIVNTSSMAGLLTPGFQAPYSTTKSAVVALSQSLRFELGDENIQISVVCPGNVVSRIFGNIPADAIPGEEAAQIILEGVADNRGIIAFPEHYEKLWRQYWADPYDYEKAQRDFARQRRENLKTRGTVE